jgi:hypothetical protein
MYAQDCIICILRHASVFQIMYCSSMANIASLAFNSFLVFSRQTMSSDGDRWCERLIFQASHTQIHPLHTRARHASRINNIYIYIYIYIYIIYIYIANYRAHYLLMPRSLRILALTTNYRELSRSLRIATRG